PGPYPHGWLIQGVRGETGDAEPDVIGAVVGAGAPAVGGAAVSGGAAPRAATGDVGAGRVARVKWGFGFCFFVEVLVVGILTPLPDVAMHVGQPPRVRRVLVLLPHAVDPRRPLDIRTLHVRAKRVISVAISQITVEHATEVEGRRRGRPASVLPLR